MKRILIPTDFSACAKNALKVGFELATELKAEILLLHVIYTTNGLEKFPEELTNFPELKRAVTKAKQHLKQDEEQYKKIAITTQVEIGTPFQVILATAKKWKPDLIIMGSHGTAEKNHPFVGSNAQKVLRGADCPVLSVQKNHTLKNLKRLTFASNFEDGCEKAAAGIMEFAQTVKAQVELLYVNTPINFKDTHYIQERFKWFEKKNNKLKFTQAIHCDYDVHRGIAHFLADEKQGIAGIVTRTRKGLPTYTLGIAESVTYHSPVPVLSVNYTK